MPAPELLQLLLDIATQRWIAAHARVIIFGDANNNVHHIREAAAAAAAMRERVVDLGGNDELPGVFAEKAGDGLLDLLFRDHVARADEHSAWTVPSGRRSRLRVKVKSDIAGANLIVNVRK